MINNMYEYLMFVLFGIILFILLNSNDGFSVGVPEYLLTIDNTDINIALSNYSHDEEAWAINEDGPLSPSNPVIMVDENRYYVYGDDSVDGINDANRNYATYVASRQSMAGGNTIQDDSSYDSDTLLQSYSSCNPSITDDILSQLRCMFEDGEIPLCDISKDTTCHQSQRGLFPVVDKYYNPRGGDSVIRNLILGESYTWSRTNELLQSGGHYILEASIFSLHSFFIEFKEGKFRILSLWEGIYGFLEFPPMSIWGNFYGHDDYNAFLDKLKLINGGDDVDLDTSGDNNFSKYRMTEDEARISTDTINEIFASRVDWNTEIFDSDWNQKGLLQQPKYIIHLESEPSSGGGGACAPVDKSELIVLNDRCINSPPNVGTQEHLESLPWSDGTNRCNWYENGMRHDGSSPRCEQYGRIGANEKCCICGGGCADSQPNPGTQEYIESLPWSDGINGGCYWYEHGRRHDGSNPRCEEYGHNDYGKGKANEKCCICGGGGTRPSGSDPIPAASIDNTSIDYRIFTPYSLSDYVYSCIDLYSLGYSILIKKQNGIYLTDIEIVDKILTGNVGQKTTREVISDKGFELNGTPILIDLPNYTYLARKPLLFNLILNSSGENIYFLAMTMGTPSTLFNYYELALSICEVLKTIYGSNLTDIETRLVIMGHSSGSGLLLVLVNEILRINPDFPIKTCVTMGLGLCDSYTVDTFERNVIDKSIEYYDILNFSNPNNEVGQCHYNHIGDNRIARKSNISSICVGEFCDAKYGLLNPELTTQLNVDSYELLIANVTKEINDQREDYDQILEFSNTIIFPPDYLDYYTQKLQGFTRDMYDNCKSKTDCTELLELFHKHISHNTLIIFRNSLYRYPKKTFLIDTLESQNLITTGGNLLGNDVRTNLISRNPIPPEEDYLCLNTISHIFGRYKTNMRID